jgi:hypothetical protein
LETVQKEERFIWTYLFSSFCPWLANSIALGPKIRQKHYGGEGMMDQNSSPHDRQEAREEKEDGEREKERGQRQGVFFQGMPSVTYFV